MSSRPHRRDSQVLFGTGDNVRMAPHGSMDHDVAHLPGGSVGVLAYVDAAPGQRLVRSPALHSYSFTLHAHGLVTCWN